MIQQRTSIPNLAIFLTTIAVCLVVLPAGINSQTSSRTFRIAFLEPGDYVTHARIRESFRNHLESSLPDGYKVEFPTGSYQSGGWKRDSTKAIARRITNNGAFDIVVAIGPWVVEDLLEAGYTKPIVALGRFDPKAEGLLDASGNPKASNLTVHVTPGKLQSDLAVLRGIVNPKTVGFLHFPSGDEQDGLFDSVKQIGKSLGFEVVTAEGFNNIGTHAFFKAYALLDKKVDALYLTSLYGLTNELIREFLLAAVKDNVAVFAADGRFLVERGALLSHATQTIDAVAIYAVSKTIRIMQGEMPSSLPTIFEEGKGLTVNAATARELKIELSDAVWLNADIIGDTLSGHELLRLPDAVGLALSQNSGYLAASEKMESAIQATRASAGNFLPEISAEGAIGYIDNNSVHNSGGRFTNERMRAELLLEQTLFSLSKINASKTAAISKELEENKLKEAALDLEFAVTLAYFNYSRALEVVRIETAQRRIVERALESAQARLRMNGGSQVDVLRWQLEQLRTQSAIVDARRSESSARVLLNVLLNRPGNNTLAIDESLVAEDAFVTTFQALESLAGSESDRSRLQDYLVRTAIESNPRSQANNIRLRSQKSQLLQNRAKRFPVIGFNASLALVDSLSERVNFEEKRPVWSLGAELRFSLFNGGKQKSATQQLEYGYSQIEYERDYYRAELMGKLQRDMYQLDAAISAVPLSAHSVEIITSQIQMAMDEYDASKRGLADMVDAVRTLREAKFDLIERRYSVYNLASSITRTVGWSPYEANRDILQEFLERLKEYARTLSKN